MSNYTFTRNPKSKNTTIQEYNDLYSCYKELERKLSIAVGALKFYSSEDPWFDEVVGAKAREALEQISKPQENK